MKLSVSIVFSGFLGVALAHCTESECRGDNPTQSYGDICRLKADSGPCEAAICLWTYDSRQRKCVQFIYGGCKGNENRFDSRRKCEKRCPGNGKRRGKSLKPTCPKLPSETFGFCEEECLSDEDCKGNKLCCFNGCGLSGQGCFTPV